MTNQEKIAAVTAKLTGSKFYAGQRVRVMQDYLSVHKGMEFTVKAIDHDGSIFLEDDPIDPRPWLPALFEPV